jgi:hypothetical protein
VSKWPAAGTFESIAVLQITAQNLPMGEVLPINNVLACIPIARQRLGKHIPAQANVSNSRASIVSQISKHASVSIDAVFSAPSVQSGYMEVFNRTEQ